MNKVKYHRMIQSIWGWHHPSDFFMTAKILETILAKSKAGKDANLLEIGIYHGRSFIPVFHYFYDNIKTFYACDPFYEPSQYDNFQRHLGKFLPQGYETKINILKEDSLNLHKKFSNGLSSEKFMYCSVDGHHTYRHTLSDLRFCAERLEDGGIIVLDDVYQFSFPEVSNAMYDFLKEYKDLKVAYILTNKVIISKDRSIVDDLYDPSMFVRYKINGEAVNVIKIAPRTGLKGIIHFIYNFVTRKPYDAAYNKD